MEKKEMLDAINAKVAEVKALVEADKIDEAKKAAQPGIVGYVVQPGDTIWTIAKKYYASIDSIKQLNELESEQISAGDRLLIVKS